MAKRYAQRVTGQGMRLADMSSGNRRNWTREEELYLFANYKTMFIEDIADHLKRPHKGTKNKAFRMGCSIKSKFTKGNKA